jgi:hypothetical protein
MTRKQCMAPERHSGLLGLGQHLAARISRPVPRVLDRRALAPLRQLLEIDANSRLSCEREGWGRDVAALTAWVVVPLP